MIMHKMKSVLAVGLMLMGTAVWAQTPPAEANSSTKLHAPIQPYADNPNLLHVWAYKAQQGVLNAADQVGEVAEKGVQKVRPSVHQAWENTKTLTSNTTQQANQKIQDTKEALGGAPQQPVPIVQGSLSQPDTAQPAASVPAETGSGATSYAVTEL